jgi:hypothetical protein
MASEVTFGFFPHSSGGQGNIYYGSSSGGTPPKLHLFTTTGRLRDGRTPDSPLLSSRLQNDPSIEFRYLANHMGQWVEIDARDGHLYESLHVLVYLFEPRPLVPAEFINPIPPPDTAMAFSDQIQQVDDQTDRMDNFWNSCTTST